MLTAEDLKGPVCELPTGDKGVKRKVCGISVPFVCLRRPTDEVVFDLGVESLQGMYLWIGRAGGRGEGGASDVEL